MTSDAIKFGNIKEAVSQFTALIKKLVAMLTNFINSWKRVPNAALPTDPATPED